MPSGDKMLLQQRKYKCTCLVCNNVGLHNLNIGVTMVETNSGSGENIQDSSVASRAIGRLLSLKLFFYSLFKHAGLFLLGIFVGMGIVLKNPPSSKKLSEKIEVLEKQLDDRGADLKVKNAIVIK